MGKTHGSHWGETFQLLTGLPSALVCKALELEGAKDWSTEPTPHGRDQIRDQDVTGQGDTGRYGCDTAAVASATKGDGGDGSGGLGPGSLCS